MVWNNMLIFLLQIILFFNILLDLMDDYYSDDNMDEVSPQNPPKTVIMQEYGDRFNNAVSIIVTRP